MRLLDSLRFRIASLFQRSEINADMEDELRSHIQDRADDLERLGVPRADAERRARIEFGGYEKCKEACRESAGVHFVETLVQDLRFAFRVLRKSPGFAAVAVLTLALGIAANAVVFSVMNAFILRPALNVPRPKDLYEAEIPSRTFAMSYPDYLDYRDRNRSFTDLAMNSFGVAAMDTGGDPLRIWVDHVSGNYFDVLGLRPFLGRFFHRSDERGPNSAPYVVLAYSFWRTHFNDDRSVVGRTVQLSKHPFTIIGVAPPGFRGTWLLLDSPVFIPMINQEQVDGVSVLNERGIDSAIHFMFGRLKKGVTPAEAADDLNSIGSYLKKTYPEDKHPSTMSLGQLGLSGHYGPSIRAFLAGLMFLAGLILLSVCANLGSLFAARAADRSREVALRLSLGAGRLRVLRQLFTEAVLISLAGGAVGLAGAVVLLRRLSVWQPFPGAPYSAIVNPDASVYGAALLLALASGFLFGAVPVKQVLRTSPYEVIKAGSSGRVGRQLAVRDLMLGAQVAICTVLVISSMVAVRGLVRSLHTSLGFEPRNTLLVNIDLKMAGYRDYEVPAMQKRMIDALESIPGVASTGLVSFPPLPVWNDRSIVFADKTADLRPSNAAADPFTYSISPEYFRAAGTVLLSGRAFTWNDDKNAPRVAVVNPEFASKLFGSAAKAIGGYYKMPDGTRIQVVGIVEEGKYTSNLAEAPQPAMFLPILQLPSNDTWLVLRSPRDPQQLSAAIRVKLRELDPGLSSYIETWNNGMVQTFFAPRITAISLGVLGVIGVLLSITGVFGLAAYSVSKRLRELGIRLALGAQRKEVLEAALGRAFKLLAFGSAAGLLLGILASRVLASIVYQATPRDPLVLAGAVLAMSLVGLLATWIPARRALSIDPSMLMREE
jgi:predicted permease